MQKPKFIVNCSSKWHTQSIGWLWKGSAKSEENH